MKTIEIMTRSLLEVVLWLFLYAIILTVSNSILALSDISPTLKILIGLTPLIPVGLVLRAIVQMLKHSDELQQRIQLLAISFSAITTALGTFAYGLLELNMGYPSMPTFSFAFVLPVMVTLWVIGMLYFRWRYR